MNTPQRDILLIEDNDGDVVLFREAMKRTCNDWRLRVAADGIEAVEVLKPAASGDAPRPDLIVLDLNLPRMSGAELVRWLLDRSSLRMIPLVVLTSSQHEQDVLSQWEQGRCLYFVKPSTFASLVETVRTICVFLSSLPKIAPSPDCGNDGATRP